jgi:pSer/pThr/pTyr-binding forkhead associated (FHA) protein
MNSNTIKLTVTQGTPHGKEYVFGERTRCIIGRADDCDIQMPADYEHTDVSRHHCMLDIDPPSVRVRDLGSRNGTFVNGKKIGQRPDRVAAEEADLGQFAVQDLKDGDEIRMGHTVFRVGVGEGVPEAACVPLYFV